MWPAFRRCRCGIRIAKTKKTYRCDEGSGDNVIHEVRGREPNHGGFLSTPLKRLSRHGFSGLCGAGFQSFAEQSNRIFRYLVFNPGSRCLTHKRPLLTPLPGPLQGVGES